MNSSTCPGAKGFTTNTERHRSKAPTYQQVGRCESDRNASESAGEKSGDEDIGRDVCCYDQ